MFCPNCGTQNDDTANNCTKCGFNLKGTAAPRFKGTMLMMNAPAGLAAAAAAQASPPAAPAPPEVPQGIAPVAVAAPVSPGAPVSPASAAAKAKLKGTMLGVAPPSPGAAPAPPFGTPLGGPPGGISPGAGFPAPAMPGVPTSIANPHVPAPVNPLGGTMVADASSFGSPGAYGAPPGPQPSWGAPPAQGYGTQPQQPVYAPPTQAGAGGYGGAPAYGSAPQYQSGALSPYGADPPAPTSPGEHGPVGKIRNPVNDMIFGAVCGFYALYVMVMGVLELKAFRQKSDISLILLLIPIVNLFVMWSLAGKMLDAKQLAGIPGARVGHPIMYLIPIYGLYCFIVDLNEVFQAASGSQAHYG